MAQDFFKKALVDFDLQNTVLVGAKIPTNLSNYLNLFCIADGISKSSIMRPLLEDWHKQAIKKFSEKDLIKLIAKRGWHEWKNRTRKNLTFNTAIAIQRRTLKKKGIEESTINKIIELIKNEKDNENSKAK